MRPYLRTTAVALFLLVSTIALAVLAAASPAAGPREDLIVNVAWLNQHLKEPNLVLLHVGPPEEYQKAHIPGARFVDLMDISAPMDHSMEPGRPESKTLSLELPVASDLHARLTALGISDNSTIVVYYGSAWYSPTTRVIFTLNWAGLGARTKLLDGGMRAWTAAGHSTTTDEPPAPAAKTGALAPLKTVDSVVDAAFVQAKKSGVVLIDARDKVFYDGVQTGGQRGGPPVLGHIAGAQSIPFGDVFDDQGNVEPAEKLAELFRQAGAKPGDEIVAYCHIGQQATAVVFAARTVGFKARLYDGSMDDWSRRGLPVQKEK